MTTFRRPQRTAILYAFCFFILAAPSRGTDLNSVADLAANSSLSDASAYVLNPGAFDIASAISIAGSGRGTVAQNSGTTLRIDNTGRAGILFRTDGYELSGGDLTVVAGSSGYNAHGLSTSTFTQTGGLLTTTGGTSGYCNGIVATTSFILRDGTIFANAGPIGYSSGINTPNFVQYGGAITAQGGDGGGIFANGIHATTYAMHDGSLVSTGGGNHDGVRINSSFVIEKGDVTATGGTGNSTHGITIQGSITQNGGSVTGYGGTGVGVANWHSYGVNVQGAYNLNNGDLRAYGGDSNENQMGVLTDTFTMTNGRVDARGGGGHSCYGLYAWSYAQTGGTVTAVGGTGGGAYGMYVNRMTQSGGQLIAIGGDSTTPDDYSVGLVVYRYTPGTTLDPAKVPPNTRTGDGVQLRQNGGTIIARGGRGDVTNVGIYGIGNMVFNSVLQLERQGVAPSLYAAADGLTLGGASTLVPVVDMANPDPTLGSGLILTDTGSNLHIEAGAKVRPIFTEHRLITKAQPAQEQIFIDTDGGTIHGHFAESRGGLTLQYSIEKRDSDSRYVIVVRREHDIVDILPLVPCENSRRLIALFDELAGVASADEVMARALFNIDHSHDVADLIQRSAHIGKTLTPGAYTKLTGTLLRSTELAQTDFARQLERSVARRRSAVGVGAPGAYAAPAEAAYDWSFWSSPLFQRSNRFSKTCLEFDDAREKLYGISAGIARHFDALSAGLALSYVRADYEADYTDSKVDNYGVTAGFRLHDLVPAGGVFSPWIAATAGYGYGDIEQKNLHFDGATWKRSTPHAHVFRTGLEVGNTFMLGDRLSLTPSLGVDYAHIRQGGYREKSVSAAGGLHVRSGGYDSLRPRAGLEIAYDLGNRLSVAARGQYRYETMDRNSAFTTSRLSDPGVVYTTDGEKRARASGSFGGDLRYRPRRNVEIAATYEYLVESKYRANRFGVELGIDF